MICRNCGATLKDGTRFCSACGKSTGAPAAPARSAAPSAPSVVVAPVVTNSVPSEYRPIGAWGYFGYSLLFSIPLVGFICLIIFSFDSSNINRRNYARSYWCWLLLAIIFTVILAVILAATGITMDELVSGVSLTGLF